MRRAAKKMFKISAAALPNAAKRSTMPIERRSLHR